MASALMRQVSRFFIQELFPTRLALPDPATWNPGLGLPNQ